LVNFHSLFLFFAQILPFLLTLSTYFVLDNERKPTEPELPLSIMKKLPLIRTLSLLLCLGAGISAHAGSTNTLPASLAYPLNSSTNRGFVVRVAQAWTTNGPVANSYSRAYRQINGTLLDTNNAVIVNAADLSGANADGTFYVDTVNFERQAAFMDVTDETGVLTSFSANFFPGIPGQEILTDAFALEAVCYLALPQGTTTFGISAGAERTDNNDDDSYFGFVAPNPRDFFGTQVGVAERHTSSPFGGNQHLETVMVLNAPVAGLYPFRIIYWQTGGGCNLNFYTIDTNGVRVLVNDPNDSTALVAYRDSSAVAVQAPYAAEVSPVPGSAGIPSTAPVTALLIDGQTNNVNLASVALTLNGSAATISKSKIGNRTSVSFSPAPVRDVNNLIRLTYTDTPAGAPHTNTWSFQITAAGVSASPVTGQWDFDFGDLRATKGNPLTYFDPTFDGPTGTNVNKTQFGTCTSFGISTINGQEAVVMRVPGDLTRRIGYVMNHGIAPNGGGTRVNQYTLIMDVLVDTSGPGAAALLQTSDPAGNTDDGDLFWQGNQFGQGTSGYNGRGTFTAGAWHRIVAAYDEAATVPVVVKYVDGIKQDDWTANQGLDAPRRTLLPTAILFGDGDQDERRVMWVNSIQIRAGRISDAECYALGGPDAAGIPKDIPQSTASGQWDFEFGDLGASVGSNLAYFDPEFDGPTGTNANLTTFGTCSALSVGLINGVDAKIVQVPGDLTRKIGYIMTHRIAPNGGGTRVNQYTLIIDVMVNNAGPGAASLLQTSDPVSNGDDGDLFWQGNQFGQGTDGYIGKGTFTPLVWHRVIAAYDEAASTPVVTKYVDGIKQHDWTANQGLDAPRRTLLPTAILFGDGDQDERRIMWVKSIQIRSGKLSDAQCAALGAPDGKPIPVVVPGTTVSGQWDFNFGDLSANIGKPLTYFDPTFDGPTGTNANLTTFGTCTALTVDNVNSIDANIVRVPGDLTRKIGYVMDHGIAPNGGGTRVNQYTLIMDIMVDGSGPGAAALWQTSDPIANSDDGDLFWQGNQFGQGTDGYIGTGAFTPLAWHRIAAAYNEAAATPVVTKYVDGIFQHDWTANQGLDAPRRTLLPTAILFGDGDQDERRIMWVDSIQIRSGALSKAELAALGPASGTGIPVVIPVEIPPTIHIGLVNGQFVMSWPLANTGYTLESAPSVNGPWTTVSGAVNNSIAINVVPGTSLLYRVKK
jgi:hypothetical protein